MKFYQTQHQFYCGVDLHSKSMHVCVVDQAGKKLLHRNFDNDRADRWLEKLAPFQYDLVVGCESTFNWHWLSDLCEEQGLDLPYQDEQGRYADFHSLRHTFITKAWETGAAPNVVMNIARHKDITTTLRYTHKDQAAQVKAIHAMTPPRKKTG